MDGLAHAGVNYAFEHLGVASGKGALGRLTDQLRSLSKRVYSGCSKATVSQFVFFSHPHYKHAQ